MGRPLDPDEAAAAMRAAGLEPLEPYPGNHTPWLSVCLRCGAECSPRLANVKSRGAGCRKCGRERTSDAQRNDPDKAAAEMRSAGAEPLEPYASFNTPWRCRCLACGAEVTPRLANVRRGQSVCRHCSYRGSSAKQRMSENDAAAVMRAAGLEPLEPYPGSGTRWLCRCATCDSEVRPTLDRVRQGKGCAVCGRRSQRRKARKPDSTAAATMVAGGYEPLVPYPGQKDAPWPCRCMKCGRELTPSLGNVRQGKGCPWCAGQRIDPAEAVEVMRSRGAEPLDPYPGNNRPWRCRCMKCGREITPTYVNARKGSPCRYCAPFGIQYDKPGVVYLLRHDGYNAIKVGISSDASAYDRTGHHAQHGWEVIETWAIGSGAQAADIERAVLRWWRDDLGAPIALGSDDMPQGGWTETAALFYVDANETASLIDKLVAALD